MAVSAAQAPQPQQPPQPQQGAPAAPHEHEHEHDMPAPKNLQVLPKTLTGDQVHEIMHGWAGALGTECSTCHAADPKNLAPNGKPRLNFADDSKPEKRTARLMYTMTEKINSDYISMVPDSDQKVTCGTCHRGHVKPEPFIPPAEHEHEHHGE
jgi:hypothetical protein